MGSGFIHSWMICIISISCVWSWWDEREFGIVSSNEWSGDLIRLECHYYLYRE